jgi:hypothetical protein
VRRALGDWLAWMGLVSCGFHATIDRYIGYYEPYATSHATLDADHALHEEVRNVARAIDHTVRAIRRGERLAGDTGLPTPRPK